MTSGKFTAIKCCGWMMPVSSIMLFTLSYYGVGPDWLLLIAVLLLVVGVLWWLQVVPAFHRQFKLEETARQYEVSFNEDYRVTGDERLLRTTSLRLKPESNRSVWLTEDNEAIGSVVGTHEMGRIWVTTIDSNERLLLRLQCANPGAWYRYGYKRKVRWLVKESDSEQAIGLIELRPTFQK